jgi:hypothetical protein
MRVFGMPLWPERLSDEEYVDKVRKGLRVVRWSRWLFAAFFVGSIVFCFWAVTHVASSLTSFGGKEGAEKSLIYAALGIAILFGSFVGFLLGHIAEKTANAFFGFRRDKLLVECWDALHKDKQHEQRS